MKPIKIMRKVDVEKQYVEMLKVEREYELASLSYAIKRQDEQEITRSKKRLTEIHIEFESLNAYA